MFDVNLSGGVTGFDIELSASSGASFDISVSDTFTITESIAAQAVWAKAHTFSADFSGAIDPVIWYTDGGAEVSFTSGQLQIFNPISNTDYQWIGTQSNFDLTNSEAKIRLIDAGNQSLTSLEVYFAALVDLDNQIYFGVSGNNLRVAKKVTGTVTNLATVAYSSTNHRWLRLRETAGTLFWETSADGLNWTTQHSEATPIDVSGVYLEMSSGTYANEASSTTVIFDDFNTNAFILSDVISITENVTLSVVSSAFTVDTFDAFTITESNQSELVLNQNVNDTVSATEDIVSLLVFFESEVDTISTTESVDVQLTLNQESVDTLSISETIQQNFEVSIFVSDDLVMTENVSTENNLFAEQFDNQTITEDVVVQIVVAPLEINVFDVIYPYDWVQRIPVNQTPTIYTDLRTKQVIYGGLPIVNTSTTSVSWATIHSQNSSESWVATQEWRRTTFSNAVEISDLKFYLSAPPGTGKSYEFALVNGISTVLGTVTISDLATEGVMSFTSRVVPQETSLSIRCTPTNTPNSTTVLWGLSYRNTVDNTFIINGSTGAGPSTVDGVSEYNNISGGATWNSSLVARENISPNSFIIRKFNAIIIAPGVGNSRTLAVVKNGEVIPSTQLVFTDTTQQLAVSDLNILVMPGDTLAIVNTAGGTPVASGLNSWSISCESFTPGESAVMGATTNTVDTIGSFLRIKSSGANSESLTESTVVRLSVGFSHILRDFILKDNNPFRKEAPDFATNTSTYRLIKNGVDDISVVLGVPDVAQSNSSSSQIEEADELTVKFSAATGTPYVVIPTFAFTQYIQPDFFNSIALSEQFDVSLTIDSFNEDTISLSEDVAFNLNYEVSVIENITIAENLVVELPLAYETSDTLTITEFLSNQLIVELSLFDQLPISESVSAQLIQETYDISVNDTLTPSEFVQNQISTDLNVFDTLTISELNQQDSVLVVNIFDSVAIGEFTDLSLNILQSVSDVVSLNEDTTLVNNIEQALVDIVVINETLLGETSVTFGLQLVEEVVIAEATEVQMLIDSVFVEHITITEYIQADSVFPIFVQDTIGVTDFIVGTDTIRFSPEPKKYRPRGQRGEIDLRGTGGKIQPRGEGSRTVMNGSVGSR